MEFNFNTTFPGCSKNREKVVDLNMIRYIQTLEPHPVQSICTINEARRMILQLSQPLANISELIHDKIEAIQKQDKKLQDENMTLGQLKKELFMPVIDLEVYTLDQPTTICTAINCSETYKVGDKDKFHYKQRCHEPCYLKNVRAETVNNQALFHCAAMNRDGVCKECNCSYTVHMHIYYTTKTVEKTIKNVNKMKNIDDTEKLLAEVEKLKAEMNMTKDELQREYDVIVNSCAKFTHFLQKNAITPFNDYYKDYIEYLITREETGGNNVSNVSHLRNLLNKYMESKKLFDGASKSESYQHAPTINSTDIQNTIRNLYGLKHTGRKIREMYECQQISRRREYEYTTQVYRPPPKPKQQNQQGLIERGINIVYNYVSRKPHKTNTVYAKGQGPSNYGDEEFRGAAYTHHAAYGKK